MSTSKSHKDGKLSSGTEISVEDLRERMGMGKDEEEVIDYAYKTKKKKLTTIEQYIVQNVFEGKWFYFSELKDAEAFATRLKQHNMQASGCNQTIVKGMRDNYLNYVRPADYHCAGYAINPKADKIELYNGDNIFNAIDNHHGKCMVKAIGIRIDPYGNVNKEKNGEQDTTNATDK